MPTDGGIGNGSADFNGHVTRAARLLSNDDTNLWPEPRRSIESGGAAMLKKARLAGQIEDRPPLGQVAGWLFKPRDYFPIFDLSFFTSFAHPMLTSSTCSFKHATSLPPPGDTSGQSLAASALQWGSACALAVEATPESESSAMETEYAIADR